MVSAAGVSMDTRSRVPDQNPDKGYYYRSDQFNFAKIGVPALYFKAGTDFRGREPGWGKQVEDQWRAERYHQPSDHVFELLSVTSLGRAGKDGSIPIPGNQDP